MANNQSEKVFMWELILSNALSQVEKSLGLLLNAARSSATRKRDAIRLSFMWFSQRQAAWILKHYLP